MVLALRPWPKALRNLTLIMYPCKGPSTKKLRIIMSRRLLASPSSKDLCRSSLLKSSHVSVSDISILDILNVQ